MNEKREVQKPMLYVNDLLSTKAKETENRNSKYREKIKWMKEGHLKRKMEKARVRRVNKTLSLLPIDHTAVEEGRH